jgi:hypothetical protein
MIGYGMLSVAKHTTIDKFWAPTLLVVESVLLQHEW